MTPRAVVLLLLLTFEQPVRTGKHIRLPPFHQDIRSAHSRTMACTMTQSMFRIEGRFPFDMQRIILEAKVELECREHLSEKVLPELLLRVQQEIWGMTVVDMYDSQWPAETQLLFRVISAANYTTASMMVMLREEDKAGYGFARGSYYLEHGLEQPKRSRYECFLEMQDGLKSTFKRSAGNERGAARAEFRRIDWAHHWLSRYRTKPGVETHQEEKAIELLHPRAAQAVRQFLADPDCYFELLMRGTAE